MRNSDIGSYKGLYTSTFIHQYPSKQKWGEVFVGFGHRIESVSELLIQLLVSWRSTVDIFPRNGTPTPSIGGISTFYE